MANSQPTTNPQNAMSYMTSANFGSPRGLVSCCKTYSRSAVTAEVASSSLVVPAIPLNGLQRTPENNRVRLGPISDITGKPIRRKVQLGCLERLLTEEHLQPHMPLIRLDSVLPVRHPLNWDSLQRRAASPQLAAPCRPARLTISGLGSSRRAYRS